MITSLPEVSDRTEYVLKLVGVTMIVITLVIGIPLLIAKIPEIQTGCDDRNNDHHNVNLEKLLKDFRKSLYSETYSWSD